MKYKLIIIAVVGLCVGCSSLKNQNVSGDWIAPFGKETLLIRLTDDGKWEWWDYKYAPPPKLPTQSGKWTIQDNILTLTVERSESCKIKPGLAIPFGLKEMKSDTITVCDPKAGKHVFKWKRKR